MTNKNGYARVTIPKGGRNGKRRRATELLELHVATGQTIVAAAKLAGLSERTARRRLKESGFWEGVQELKNEMFGQTKGQILAAATKAVQTLVELLDSSNSPSIRHQSAKTLLELGLKQREFELKELAFGLQRELHEALEHWDALEVRVKDLESQEANGCHKDC